MPRLVNGRARTSLDLAHLDQVAAVVERLKAPAYSEHLAFTPVAGRDLADLLPLPRTEAITEQVRICLIDA